MKWKNKQNCNKKVSVHKIVPVGLMEFTEWEHFCKVVLETSQMFSNEMQQLG